MGAFVYADAVINVICIGLMFKHNDHQYRILCRCCIIFCLWQCDHSQDKLSKRETVEYANDEINEASLEINKAPDRSPSISQQSQQTTSTPDFMDLRSNSVSEQSAQTPTSITMC